MNKMHSLTMDITNILVFQFKFSMKFYVSEMCKDLNVTKMLFLHVILYIVENLHKTYSTFLQI